MTSRGEVERRCVAWLLLSGLVLGCPPGPQRVECLTDGNCPADQRCGSDCRCSAPETVVGVCTPDAGPAGTDAGPPKAPIEWTRVDVPPGVELLAVAGFGSEQFAIDPVSGLFRATDGGFSVVPGFSLPTARDVLMTSSGGVHVLAGGGSRYCRANCGSSSNFTPYAAPAGAIFLRLCGRGELIFALSSNPSAPGALYAFQAGPGWQPIVADLGLGANQTCSVLPSGEVLVVGQRGVARVTGNTFVNEPIDAGTPSRLTWTGLAVTTSQAGVVNHAMALVRTVPRSDRTRRQAGGRCRNSAPGSNSRTSPGMETMSSSLLERRSLEAVRSSTFATARGRCSPTCQWPHPGWSGTSGARSTFGGRSTACRPCFGPGAPDLRFRHLTRWPTLAPTRDGQLPAPCGPRAARRARWSARTPDGPACPARS